MFKNNPEAALFFNKANQRKETQPAALANAVIAYASHIDQLHLLSRAVDLIAHKHCGLQVLPEHYAIVEKNLMIAIAEVLGDAVTAEVGAAWTEAVQALSKILIDHEEGLYKVAEAKKGGWRGWKEFTIDAKDMIADDVALLTLKCNGSDAFDFTPGQFLTVRLSLKDGNPRHYTVVSEPGATHLQIAVRHVKATEDGAPDGVVSTHLCTMAEIGDHLYVSPPFGGFGVDSKRGTEPHLLVSAGIGCTPTVAKLKHLTSNGNVNVVLVHQDRTQERHAFKKEMATLPGVHSFCYSSRGARIDDTVLQKALADANIDAKDVRVSLCGPVGFMQKAQEHLLAIGVEKTAIRAETFAPQLSTGFTH